jgi:hypothetical protein
MGKPFFENDLRLCVNLNFFTIRTSLWQLLTKKFFNKTDKKPKKEQLKWNSNLFLYIYYKKSAFFRMYWLKTWNSATKRHKRWRQIIPNKVIFDSLSGNKIDFWLKPSYFLKKVFLSKWSNKKVMECVFLKSFGNYLLPFSLL